ncbi:MAG: Gfo/Idh/MocA family oxidoreductase [Dysgonamonadaceae bacterium]|nr:Gfo/Idh/MocA family oxidoreductase [Dysgonamonadaceae bacterium]MDD4729229.1 Gfo/Idh/MocA family oxidoreductase [Dysgonamonadaceae bacterium]
MKTWKIGIVGTGMIADMHAQAIESLPNAQLVGFCNIRKEGAIKMAKKHHVKSWDTISEMLQSDEIDIAMIATPSGAHMEPTIEAAKYGKHVLCEKPLEIKLDRIDKMIEAHEEANTYLGGIFNLRYNETTQIIKNAIDANRLGTITYAAAHIPWWRSNAYYEGWHGTWSLDGGGAMMNQSIHMVDLLQYLMGPVDNIAAFTSKTGHPHIETEDTCVSILQFKNKALGTVYGSTASFPGQYRRLEITGTKGTIVLVENSLKVWQFEEETEEDKTITEKFGAIEGGGGVADPAAILYINHAKNIAAFIDAIEKGIPFEIDGKEARKAVELVLDMYNAAGGAITN